MTSKKNSYRLLNPYIEGKHNTVVHASNSLSGGKKHYANISNYFTNHVEEFYLTLQNVQTKKLTHFRVKEKMKGKKGVEYDLEKLPEDKFSSFDTELIKKVEQLEKSKQKAGDKNDKNDKDNRDGSDSSDSSSDSDSDEDDIEYITYIKSTPISRFVYFPLPYYRTIGLTTRDINKIFMPMFNLPVNPSVEIRLDIYNYKH